jgi:hypothetical protein
VDTIRGDLLELCLRFLELLDILKEKGMISDAEYEIYGRQKRLFIHKEKSKPSS